MKPEILAPVGNIDHLYAAIAAGCDAVYFALPDFSARAFAKNFTSESAKEAIDLCHSFGVKVYITMNTILYQDEIEQAYKQAKLCYEMGADALIIQDLGLMYLIHKRLPEAEIHASTQVSVTTSKQIEQLKRLGVKRVVLARECSKEMVEECKKAGLEIEIFIHGALCISMSGRCYFSSFCHGRSGNRGQCAQPCRMQYDLLKNGKKISTQGSYLLSPKDLSLIDKVQDLNVDSLKIEGRMKSVEYVYESVSQTRYVLDGNKRNDDQVDDLKTSFYRGYTKGHYFQEKGKDFIHQESCNHKGLPIGKVIAITKDKIGLLCQKDIYQHDGIRIGKNTGCMINYLYDQQGKLQNHIKAGQPAWIDKLEDVKKGDILYRTISVTLQQKVQKQIQANNRKVDVHLGISCQGIGCPLVASVNDGKHQIQVTSNTLATQAQNQPLNKDILLKQIQKTKSSWVNFLVDKIELADSLFFTMGALNQFRRDIIETLYQKRIEVPFYEEKELEIDLDIPSLSGVVTKLDEQIANQDWNITNAYAILGALTMGYQGVYISEECDKNQIQFMLEEFRKLTQKEAPVIKLVYGHHRFMIMNHCPINTNLSNGQRTNCSMCRKDHYQLKGKDGITLNMLGNEACQMELYHNQLYDQISAIEEYKELGISAFYIHPLFIEEKKLEKVIKEVEEKA